MLQALSKKGTNVEKQFEKIMDLPTEINARFNSHIQIFSAKTKFEDKKRLKKNMNFLKRKMSLKKWEKKLLRAS